MTIDEPRSLKSAAAIAARHALLDQPHMAGLREYTAALRVEGRGAVPECDPLDGGANARLLFLMEKPGPMTDNTAGAAKAGSGFVSRDNDDPTAEAIFRFMRQAGIKRQETLLWNTVPWWNGTRAIRSAELAAGLERLDHLFCLLPKLTTVIGVGNKAGQTKPLIVARGLSFYCSAHPSPINRAVRPLVWEAIPLAWQSAARGK